MIKLTQERVKDVLAYMEDDLPNCLYLYGDIVRYGINDPNMTVWFSEKDGKINAVVMKYFSGSHVYSKQLDYDLDEVVEKLREIDPDRISSQRLVIEALAPLLRDKYDVEYGTVFKEVCYRRMRSSVAIERATPEDAGAIAELLMTAEDFAKTYEQRTLAEELANRMRNGIGRSYIIRDGERIVAHSCVSLETDQYMIESMTVVHDDYRPKMYGLLLDSYMINDITEEGKALYGMVVEGPRLEGFIKMGHQPVARYGKLFRRNLQEG